MISVTLARRYARALLHTATKHGTLDLAEEELLAIAALARRDARVRRFFETPGIARSEKVRFLEASWKPRLSRPVYGLLMVLLRRRRLDHIVVIAEEFDKLFEDAKGRSRLLVRTAVPLTDAQAGTLTQALADRTGRTIVLTREVDPSVIGGAIVSLDHRIVDATIATELWRIRRRLLATRVHG